MTEKKGHGSATAQTANAKAAKERESNPRSSSSAQAELGKKGGKAANKRGSLAIAASVVWGGQTGRGENSTRAIVTRSAETLWAARWERGGDRARPARARRHHD